MSKIVGVEVANIKEAMTGANNEKVITPYSLNQVIKRKTSASGTPGVGLNYYWSGTELGVKREDEQDYTFVELKGEPGSAGADGTNGIDGVDGVDGRAVEIQTSATHIQWRYAGDTSWVNLIALSSLAGADGADGTNGVDGKEVMLQKTATHIQWKYDTDVTWTDLVALADLKGADGEGVPIGGTIGQVLKKKSSTNFDTEWGAAADPNAIKSSDGSVTDIREVTQAEYDALTQTEKDEGTFFITDDLAGAINVVNGFASTSTTDPGSAKNDKDLKDLIDGAVAQLYKTGINCPNDNANDALSDGCYTFGPSTANKPSNDNYGTIFTMVSTGLTGNNTDNWVNQFAFGTGNTIRFRQKINADAWTNWEKIVKGSNPNLVADYFLSTNATSFTISGLDIIRDGGIYEIYCNITTNEIAEIYLKLNGNLANGTRHETIVTHSTSSPFGVTSYYQGDGEHFGIYFGRGGPNALTMTKITLWRRSNNRIYYQMESDCYEADNHIRLVDNGIVTATQENITSLTIGTLNGTSTLIAVSTNVKVYKR